MNHHHANRLFLLTLIAPSGCDPEPAPDDTSAATTVGETGGGMDTSVDDAGASMGDSTGGADSTGAATGGGATGADPLCEEAPVIRGTISQVCIDEGEWAANCYFDGDVPQECIGYYEALCQASLDQHEAAGGEACRAAMEDVFACINGMTCREFDGTDEPCPAEEAALIAACPDAG
ncbi:MAG: hypothetical protein AAF721_25330 [Myxococcota bacterium]